MLSLISILYISAMSGSALASPVTWNHGHRNTVNKTWDCGEVSIFSTGLPAYHPLVKAQGADPDEVYAAMQADFQKTIHAGYNLKVVLMGPEKSVDELESRIPGTDWQGTHIGFGVRGSSFENLTYLFTEDTVDLFRHAVPGPIVFDYDPNSATDAFDRAFHIAENCTDRPGTLDVVTLCDICDE